jgi:hypothetical protein
MRMARLRRYASVAAIIVACAGCQAASRPSLVFARELNTPALSSMLSTPTVMSDLADLRAGISMALPRVRQECWPDRKASIGLRIRRGVWLPGSRAPFARKLRPRSGRTGTVMSSLDCSLEALAWPCGVCAVL